MLEMLKDVTSTEILISAFLALIITLAVLKLMNGSPKGEVNVRYNNVSVSDVARKCTELFPIDTVIIRGNTFKRGMKVKMTTLKKQVIEGEFIGKNSSGFVCIVTKNHIVAHEVSKIMNMETL